MYPLRMKCIQLVINNWFALDCHTMSRPWLPVHIKKWTRILHAIDAANNDFLGIMIRTVDTDAIVVAVSNCALFDET